MLYLPLIHQVLLLLLALTAGFEDLRTRRVPNWLTLAGVLLGFLVNGLSQGTQGLLYAAKGLGLALAIYFALFALRAMGAGDVKLMAAIGSIAGWTNWLGIMVLTWLVGGLIALVLIVVKGRVRRTIWNLGLILVAVRTRQAPHQLSQELDVGSERALRLPHAIAICLGTLAFLVFIRVWVPR